MSRTKLYPWLLGIGVFPFLVNGYVNSLLQRWPTAYWTFEFVCWILLPTVLFSFAVRKYGLKFAEFGLSTQVFGKRNLPVLVLLCVGLCPVALFVYKSTYTQLSSVFVGEPFFSYESLVPTSGWSRLLVSVYFGLTAGIVEELYFRGLLYKAVSHHPDANGLFMLLSPILFAAVHWEGGLVNVFSTYVFGLFTAGCFLAIRNLWPLIIGHSFTDYVLFSQSVN